MKVVSPSAGYICFTVIRTSIQEGDAYIFVAIDVESEYVFQLGVGFHNDAQTFIKQINVLLQHKDFAPHISNGFTLVFESWPPVPDQLTALLEPFGGSFIIDKGLYERTVRPFLDFLQAQADQ